jgi:hypothetical protein
MVIRGWVGERGCGWAQRERERESERPSYIEDLSDFTYFAYLSTFHKHLIYSWLT